MKKKKKKHLSIEQLIIMADVREARLSIMRYKAAKERRRVVKRHSIREYVV